MLPAASDVSSARVHSHAQKGCFTHHLFFVYVLEQAKKKKEVVIAGGVT